MSLQRRRSDVIFNKAGLGKGVVGVDLVQTKQSVILPLVVAQ